MKPTKNTIQWLLPELSEAQLKMLEQKMLECVGEDEEEYDSPWINEPAQFNEDTEGQNRVRQDIRTHIKELFGESK